LRLCSDEIGSIFGLTGSIGFGGAFSGSGSTISCKRIACPGLRNASSSTPAIAPMIRLTSRKVTKRYCRQLNEEPGSKNTSAQG
jgi:hypothetical protein